MTLESLRDIAIILVAAMNLTLLVALVIIAIALYRKLGPLLASAQTAINTIQGTTSFIAETTVHPIIRVLSFVSGVRAAAGTVGRRGGGKGGK